MYTLIEFAGKQYKIEEGNSIKVPYVTGKVGSKVTIDKILYIDDGKNKTVGTPLVKGAKISAEIESHGRERKVVVFKFKRRKGYQKKNTHRQEYTILKFGKLGTVKKMDTATKTASSTTKKAVDKQEPKIKTASKIAAKKTATKKTPIKKAIEKKKDKE